MRRLAFTVLLLLWPAVAGAQVVSNDSTLGATVTLVTNVEGVTRISGAAHYEKNSYIPAGHVWIAFGDDPDFTDRPRIQFASPDGVNWTRSVVRRRGLPLAGNLTDLNIYARGESNQNILGLSLACTQETPRRLVCRGGPQL